MCDAARVAHGVLHHCHVVKQGDIRGELHVPDQVLLAPIPAAAVAAQPPASVKEAHTARWPPQTHTLPLWLVTRVTRVVAPDGSKPGLASDCCRRPPSGQPSWTASTTQPHLPCPSAYTKPPALICDLMVSPGAFCQDPPSTGFHSQGRLAQQEASTQP